MSEPIEITVNGERRLVAPGTTIEKLLEEMELTRGRVAVERNHEVVPRAEHPSATLEPGDRLEVVTFVGGG